MEKSKVKSILPKPSPSMSQTPSPSVSTSNKRKSLNNIEYSNSNTNNTTMNVNQNNKRPRNKSTSHQNRSVNKDHDDGSKNNGHRPVTSCTFCRQHKIKCNASENFPNPCERCERMDLKCEIDPQFRPKKGSQIQSLKSDVDELKAKIELLTKNETLLTQALTQRNLNQRLSEMPSSVSMYNERQFNSENTPQLSVNSDIDHITPMNLDRSSPNLRFNNLSPRSSMLNDSVSINPQLPNVLNENSTDNSPSLKAHDSPADFKEISEFILGDVCLSLEKANKLHDRFITKFLPFLPIIESKNATELYHKSQLLFWSVILTASLSEPEPSLYMNLSSLIKQLAIETCWIRTPRSTHVIQALIILSIWPLPNEKVLDDCSYRFVGLAKNLSLQLGLHRGGDFIKEFSRTQVSLGPRAELWRTRSWLAVFFCDQFWSSVLGLPPLINTTDYLLENARVDNSLPKEFRCLISLSIFQCKLVNVMGISVTRPDGLLEPSNRAGSLNILDRELERLKFKLSIPDGSPVEIYFLYIKLMICCFAFLPGTPIEDQVKYVSSAYLSATRIITITSQMINNNTILLIELPIYIRQAITYSVLLLFKLHLSRYLMDKYVDSARQLIVTVHRLLRNTLSSWKSLQNDISRTAKVLENLNIVLYTYPEIFYTTDDEDNSSIITRMRSHLTASLFYDLVWCVHEARRRTLQNRNNPDANKDKDKEISDPNIRKPTPLPFYNQITKDDFKTIITTTPNGTTVTTLVPTDQALDQAKVNANANGLNKPLEINGIPLAMLEATGSFKDIDSIKGKQEVVDASSTIKQEGSSMTSDNLNHAREPVPTSQTPPTQNYQNLDSMNDQTLLISNSNNLPDQNMDNPIVDNSLSVAPTPSNLVYGMNNGVADQMDNFFQQQSNGWVNNENYQEDDFLGWFDVNMVPDN